MEQGNDRKDIPIQNIVRPLLQAEYTANSPRGNGTQNNILANISGTTQNSLGISSGGNISWTVTEAGLYILSAESRWNVIANDSAELGIGWCKGSLILANLIGCNRTRHIPQISTQHCFITFYGDEWLNVGDVVTFVTISRTSAAWVSQSEGSYVSIRLAV